MKMKASRNHRPADAVKRITVRTSIPSCDVSLLDSVIAASTMTAVMRSLERCIGEARSMHDALPLLTPKNFDWTAAAGLLLCRRWLTRTPLRTPLVATGAPLSAPLVATSAPFLTALHPGSLSVSI
jgi:hypothetical protein